MAFKLDPNKDVFIDYGNGYKLHLQYGYFDYGNDSGDEGYRHVWEYPDGTFHPRRGHSRIPSHEDAMELILKAMRAGW